MRERECAAVRPSLTLDRGEKQGLLLTDDILAVDLLRIIRARTTLILGFILSEIGFLI